LAESLEDIIKSCIAGKSSAREKLYNMLSGKMWAVCLRYAPTRDDAKDILQEGFIKVFENIGQFEGRGNFEGWVRRIMINTALSEYRRRNYLQIESEYKAERDNRTIELTESNISANELLEMIQELPPQYRMVFNLYAIEGFSHKEIAQMLNIAEGSSKSNLSRARDILQKKVEMQYKIHVNLG
jgi:RNA polymerase sigma-70 factor (ECF subfamily)